MELKPCPFCGGHRLYIENMGLKPASEDHGGKPFIDISCDECKASVCGFGVEETAEKWNRRSRVRCGECVHWREVRMADGTVMHRCSGVMAYVTPDEDGYCKWGRRITDVRQGE